MSDEIKYVSILEASWHNNKYKCKLDITNLDANAMFYYDDVRSEVELELTEEMVKAIRDWCDKVLNKRGKRMEKYIEKAYLKGLDDASKFVTTYTKKIDNKDWVNILEVIKSYRMGVMDVLKGMEYTYKMLIGDNE